VFPYKKKEREKTQRRCKTLARPRSPRRSEATSLRNGEVCTTSGEKGPHKHSQDRSRAAAGHWPRACDARMSSSSRSSAVNSPCAPNGSSGSGAEAAGKPRARLLVGYPVPGGGPGRGDGGPLRLLLPGAEIPAMPPFGPKRRCKWSPSCKREAGAGSTARAPSLASASSAWSPTPQANQLLVGGRSLMTLIGARCHAQLPLLRPVRRPVLAAWRDCLGLLPARTRTPPGAGPRSASDCALFFWPCVESRAAEYLPWHSHVCS
jgi:hypothetical protein